MIFKAVSSQHYCLHANNPHHALSNGMCVNTTKNTEAKALLRNFCSSVPLIIFVQFIQITKQESQTYLLAAAQWQTSLHMDWNKKIETDTDMHTRQKAKEKKICFPRSHPWKYNTLTVPFPASHTQLSTRPQLHQEIHNTHLAKKHPPQKPTCLHSFWV